jgi:hypothetical protein
MYLPNKVQHEVQSIHQNIPVLINKTGMLPNKILYLKNKNPWPESASELYQLGNCRLSANLMPTFADRRCHVVSMTDPYGRILHFLDQGLLYPNNKIHYEVQSIHQNMSVLTKQHWIAFQFCFFK